VTLGPSTASPTPDPWASLYDRPLQLEHIGDRDACPRSTGRNVDPHFASKGFGTGPIYVLGFSSPSTPDGVFTLYPDVEVRVNGGYQFGVGLWVNVPTYLGTALLRGASIDESGNRLWFDLGRENRQVNDVRLPLDPRDLGAPHADMRRYWITTRVTGAGCYGYQVDGLGFTEIIVVEAVVAQATPS
jgi:hypothetical protein